MNVQARRHPDYVPLGFVSGVHGIRGCIKVHSWTRPRDAILKYSDWLLGDARQRVEVIEARRQGKSLVAEIGGVEDRESARRLVGQEIAVARDALPEPADGEHYWADLVGLEVVNREGVSLGTVERLMETGANDVLVVEGERQRLIPWVRERYVIAVDLDGGRLEVDWHPDD